MEPQIPDSTNCYGLDYRALRWIYCLFDIYISISTYMAPILYTYDKSPLGWLHFWIFSGLWAAPACGGRRLLLLGLLLGLEAGSLPGRHWASDCV